MKYFITDRTEELTRLRSDPEMEARVKEIRAQMDLDDKTYAALRAQGMSDVGARELIESLAQMRLGEGSDYTPKEN